ncbi:adenine nucleotide alpha hydrolases-like protein, partial [Hesseltinella vesiculosa]
MNTLQLPPEFLPKPVKSEISPRKIAIAYDQSDQSDATFAKAIRDGFLLPTDDIHIVHITDQDRDWSHLWGTTMSGGATYMVPIEGEREHTSTDISASFASNLLNELKMVLVKNGFQKVTVDSIVGNPKNSIVDYCIDCRPDMLLCSSRGFGSIKGAILGSVSSYLVRHCPCPVMIVKLTDEELAERKKFEGVKKRNFALVSDICHEKSSS